MIQRNLENFPSNKTALDMMNMVTKGWYDNSYIGKWLFQAIGIEMEDAINKFDELKYQIFPETATWGIVYHELKYGIEPNKELDLEARRINVIAKRDMKSPINPAKIERAIVNIAGQGYTAQVIENYAPYTFLCVISGFDLDKCDNINYANINLYIRKVKPSHLSYFFRGNYESILNNFFEDDAQIELIYSSSNVILLTNSVEFSDNLENKFIVNALLSVGKEPWYLDGKVLLDGSHDLQLGIIEYDL